METPQVIHVIRCSSLDRTLACPGSLVVTELVAPRQGDEGEEGTDLHAWSAQRLKDELGATSEIPEFVSLTDLKRSMWISDFYFRHIRDTVPLDFSLEVEAGLSYEFRRFILSGHIDCVALSPDVTEAIGFDLKTGYLATDVAENNWQIFGYACLLLRAYPTLTKITFYIVQPRNNEDDGFQRISSVTIEGERLANALATLESKINAALDNTSELNTTPNGCKWCVGCSCPAIQAQQRKMKLTLTPQILATIKRTPDDALLGDFVVTGRMLAKPMEDAVEMLHARLDATESVTAGDGTVITRTTQRGAYSVPDPVKFMQAVRTLLPKDESIAKTFTPSMTRIKDEIASEMNVAKTSKAGVSAEGIFDAHLRVLVEQGERRILRLS